MQSLSRIAGMVLVLMLGLVAQAQTPKCLAPSAVDPAKLLPDPPREDSRETKAELMLLLMLQEQRTPEEIARCQSEAKLTAFAFQNVMGPWFTAENLPQTMQLLDMINKDGKFFCDGGKKHFARRRPHFLEPKLTPLFAGLDEPCYPGGHSTQSMCLAMILGELTPDLRPALFERAREIGWNRIVAGVHYPSDNVAGRTLGHALAQAMLANPALEEPLAKAKAEIAAKRQAAGPAITIVR